MQIAETSPSAALNEAGIATLVATFYARVRSDDLLEPVFARAIPEAHWAHHFSQMRAFWSSVVLSSGRYQGKPVQMHARHLDVLTPAMFHRWLDLWTRTAQDLFSPVQAELFVLKANQIATSLQFALFGMKPIR